MNGNGCQPNRGLHGRTAWAGRKAGCNQSLPTGIVFALGHLVEDFLRLKLCAKRLISEDTGARFIFHQSFAREHKTKQARGVELAAGGRTGAS